MRAQASANELPSDPWERVQESEVEDESEAGQHAQPHELLLRFLSPCGNSFGEEGPEEKSPRGISWSDGRQMCGVWVINRDENIYLQPVT